MRHIIGAFSTLIFLLLHLWIGAAVLTFGAEAAAAKEYKAAVIAEIENSNFNPNVIAGCRQEATRRGYLLEVQCSTYDEEQDIRSARVRLSYSYEIPLLGISGQKMTEGVAR